MSGTQDFFLPIFVVALQNNVEVILKQWRSTIREAKKGLISKVNILSLSLYLFIPVKIRAFYERHSPQDPSNAQRKHSIIIADTRAARR